MYLGSIIALAFLSLAPPTFAQKEHDTINPRLERSSPLFSSPQLRTPTTTRAIPAVVQLRKMREKAPSAEEGVVDITKPTADPQSTELSGQLNRKDEEEKKASEGLTHARTLSRTNDAEGTLRSAVERKHRSDSDFLPDNVIVERSVEQTDEIVKRLKQLIGNTETELEEIDNTPEEPIEITKNENLRLQENFINVSKNGGIENNFAEKGEVPRSNGRASLRGAHGTRAKTKTTNTNDPIRFVKISTIHDDEKSTIATRGSDSYEESLKNITNILLYSTNGTTIVYEGTTFRPILSEELRKKAEYDANELNENASYLPLTTWNPESIGTEKASDGVRTTSKNLEPREEDVIEAADFGMQAMNDLYYIKEPKLFSMGLFLRDDNPARYVAAFNSQTEGAKQLAKFGYAALEGARMFVNKYPDISREASFVRDTRRTALHRQCPRRGVPPCPPASIRYRTADGSCNNPQELWWGSAMSTMNRLLPPVYQDGIQSIRRSRNGRFLPSPREISNIVHQDRDIPLASVTHMLMQWGQFIDHDITATGQSRAFNGTVPQCCLNGGAGFQPPEFMHPECLPIAVPLTDNFYARLGVRCLEFVRSGPAPREDCGFGPREQLSQVTSYLDASTVYSSDALVSDSLRIFRNGLLQYGRIQSRKPLLPRQESDLCIRGSLSTSCFRAGDGRLSEQPALISLHVVFLRQHNRMATQLAALNPHWSDEKLFQEARRIIGAFVQHITYREFLPIVLGPDVMRLFDLVVLRKGYYEGYDSAVNPNIVNSFSSAAFRFGHSLVQPSFVRYDRDHRPIFNNVSLHDEFSNPVNLQTAGSVDRVLLGLVNQPSQKRDEFITVELTNHLFQTPGFPFGMDLASLNIQRGRDHGLPPYVEWREPCSLSPIRIWEDLDRVMPAETARKFRLVYSSVEDIDLFPAGMAENPVPGGLVGPTFACIIAQQFSNLRKGDRFWFENPNRENSFTAAQLQQIRRVTLAQILCKTTDSIETIQPFVFLTPDTIRNKRVSCSSDIVGNFDLNAWAERIPEQRNNSKKKNKTRTRTRTKNRNETKNRGAKRNSTTPATTQKKNDEAGEKTVPDNQKSFFDVFKPVKSGINQHNKIVVKRPFGTHENLTIVVQNHAVNSPVFVNDAVSGTNFQLTQTPLGTPNRPGSTGEVTQTFQDPIHYGDNHHSPVRPTHRPGPKPIPTVRPYGNEPPHTGAYVPHNFEDPSNPNPPSYGFAPKPVNNYFPANGFFDRPQTTTPRPTLYTYYTNFKPIPTRRPAARPQYDAHSHPQTHHGTGHVQQDDDPDTDYYNHAYETYGFPKPSDDGIIVENSHDSWTSKPTFGQSWTPQTGYDQNWSNGPPLTPQSDTDGWTNIPTYSVKKPPPHQRPTQRPTHRPDPSKPQYWPYHSTTTKRYPSTGYYYGSDYQIANAEANINPRPYKTQSLTVVTDTDEDVYYSNERYRPQNKNELPRPFLAQHKEFDEAQHKHEDDAESTTKATEIRRSGQYYYDKNILHRYPDGNRTNEGDSSSHRDLAAHQNDEQNTKDKLDVVNEKDGKIIIDNKYKIERLGGDRGGPIVVNADTNAQIVREEIKFTTTATIVLDDANDPVDTSYNDDTNDNDDDDLTYDDVDQDDDLEGAYSEISESVSVPDGVINRPIDWLHVKENFSLTSNAEMPQVQSDGLLSAKELPKPFKLHRQPEVS